ncbi:hypothetical protein PGB34_16700 [Xenophilus arseniciresistens]|uniref:Uncharacterized protein n=1 Tax=Xenophilus arseniciresistens TaxID=1283306 RepID=A0AAE3N8P0_9BURK|nr:hypothetical protein [Xenophilus arseniciresistens]MDA7418005.1 hypothetical protein [Xenophilus arseniciresistens]
MSKFETDSPSLFERCFAAVFSGLAAGVTYALWLFFHSGQWGAEQLAAVKDIGKWIVLAGTVLGFFGGISLVARLWGHVWESQSEPRISMRTALVLLALVAVGYWVLKQ